MSLGSSFSNELFAEQFERHGDGYVFRRSSDGAGWKVTEAERDRFVADFQRGVMITIWVAPILLVVGLVALFIGTRGLSDLVSDVIGWVLPILLMLAIWAWMYWLWRAPARILATRTPEVQPLSSEVLSQQPLSRTVVGACVLFAMLAIGRAFDRDPTFKGEGWLWIALGLGLLGLVGFRLLRDRQAK